MNSVCRGATDKRNSTLTDANNAIKPSRRSFLRTAALGATAATSLFYIGKSHAQQRGRVIMLGYDGMEPSIVDEMLAQGDLPNLQRLRDMGGYSRLQSTIPPQSPVAWNSYATCKNPGGHNIFDFIRRDPAGQNGPLPLVGTGKLNPYKLTPDGSLIEAADCVNYRKGTPFWSVADQQGMKGKVLNIPFAFPPDPLENGIMISALGVPDLRGTTSTYFSLSDSFTPEALKEDLGGGQRISLRFDGMDEALLPIPGPRDNRYPFSSPQAYVKSPLRFQVNRKDRRGTVTADTVSIELEEGQWSPWLELHFKMTPEVDILGMTRFYPMEIGDCVRIYMSCVQYHPDAPYTTLSSPASYSAELKGRFGLYKTIGWAYDTHAVRQNDLEEDAFLKDFDTTMSFRDQLTLDELKRGDFDFLLSAWTATDRAGHMFWRYRDEKHPYYSADAPEHWKTALEYTYKRADAQAGAVLKELRDEDTLFVFSDHGFGSWRQGFNLNTWLRDEGYLAVKDPALADRGFLMGVDWSKTKAYSVGLSSLYLNVKGRETGGIVERADAEALIAELQDKLAEVKDPQTGAKIFSKLYPHTVYTGETAAQAPDISLGYAPYYQSGRQTSRGGVGEAVMEPVMDKWSGEHASTDYMNCPGILFSNKPLAAETPHIQDLGVTALAQLGVDIPADYDGETIV